jgi:trimethylamine:corrinoid methyltransferase-like protein
MDKVEAATKSANTKLIRMAARSALATAGLQGKPDKLIPLLDLEGADVDDDGNVTGLDKPVAALKKEYPSLFGTTQNGQPQVGNLNIGNRPVAPSGKKGYAEQVAESLFVA